MELEMKSTIPFTLAPPKMKYLGINVMNISKIYMRKTIKL